MQRSGPGPLTGSPSASIDPEVTGSRPAIIESKVLLPQPLGPSITTNSPGDTSRVIPSTATTSGVVLSNTFVTDRQRTVPVAASDWAVWDVTYRLLPSRAATTAAGSGLAGTEYPEGIQKLRSRSSRRTPSSH